jgi:type VI protein secretion system component Hcp
MAAVLKVADATGALIKGESKVPGHVDEIDVQDWSWGMTAPAGTKLDIRNVQIKKSFDLASLVLLAKTATHEMLEQGLLTVVDQQGRDLLVVWLTGIAVEEIIITGERNPPSEQIILRIDEIRFIYKGKNVTVRRLPPAGRRNSIPRRKR